MDVNENQSTPTRENTENQKPNNQNLSVLAEIVSNDSSNSSLKRKRSFKIQIPEVISIPDLVLREVPPEVFKFRDSSASLSSQNDAVSFSSSGVGVFSVKGKKRVSEDAYKVVLSCPNKRYFGVFDGHGGRKAVDYATENLHKNIFEHLENCKGTTTKEEAVKAAYLKTDQDFLKLGVGSGACCLTALIAGKEIVVSNLGDCRAVLCRGGVAEALTADHRAGLDDEKKRIENKGGYVEMHRGSWRVHGILSVSRSFGDAHLKEWVVGEPETKILHLTSDMNFLVLASDGLWEQVGNQEVVDTVMHSLLGEKKFPMAIQKENDAEVGCLHTSSSPKSRRILLVKHKKKTGQSPILRKTVDRWKEVEDFNACENESPPSKVPRVSGGMQRGTMTKSSPSEENHGYRTNPASDGLVASCKELVNLAVERGSLDDITVMIIDLTHFRISGPTNVSNLSH
ncbi:PPM-type phosphatase-like domain [Dillenia turbinata]|uniref:protein-serine/threonine phosphatase n=1 Tax=Dillenia turbinata TaxID=194707 RepID=A0AAN8VJA1_9MAGN